MTDRYDEIRTIHARRYKSKRHQDQDVVYRKPIAPAPQPSNVPDPDAHALYLTQQIQNAYRDRTNALAKLAQDEPYSEREYIEANARYNTLTYVMQSYERSKGR